VGWKQTVFVGLLDSVMFPHAPLFCLLRAQQYYLAQPNSFEMLAVFVCFDYR
jgi:hypothetical protein